MEIDLPEREHRHAIKRAAGRHHPIAVYRRLGVPLSGPPEQHGAVRSRP
jgi:hypothetical protein